MIRRCRLQPCRLFRFASLFAVIGGFCWVLWVYTARRQGSTMQDVNEFDSATTSAVDQQSTGADQADSTHSDVTTPSYDVHIFYYPWYGNPTHDGTYLHWNHDILPHWDEGEAKKWQRGRHRPPDDIGSSFFPQMGCYSSKDESMMHVHMQMIRSTRAGVVVVSWYPPAMSDQQGEPFDALILPLLNAADKYKLKIALHIEPYESRNAANMRDNIIYIIDKYGTHPAFYKRSNQFGFERPVFFVYDSYIVPDAQWKTILLAQGANTLRRTPHDSIFLGLLVDDKHKMSLLSAGFDGFYTYFAAEGFTYGSTWKRWNMLQIFAKKHRLIFAPSVGPGYIDEQVRPWNAKNTKERHDGNYYRDSWRYAIQSKSEMIGITSFNEWHEGTQIEPAVPKTTSKFTYLNYEPNEPSFYLTLTKELVDQFVSTRS